MLFQQKFKLIEDVLQKDTLFIYFKNHQKYLICQKN